MIPFAVVAIHSDRDRKLRVFLSLERLLWGNSTINASVRSGSTAEFEQVAGESDTFFTFA